MDHELDGEVNEEKEAIFIKQEIYISDAQKCQDYDLEEADDEDSGEKDSRAAEREELLLSQKQE